MFLPRLNSAERAAFVATALHFAELGGPMTPSVAARLAYVAREANIKLDGTLKYDADSTLNALESLDSKGVFILELIVLSHLADLRDTVHLVLISEIGTKLAIDSDIIGNVDLWAQQFKSTWQAGRLMIDAISSSNQPDAFQGTPAHIADQEDPEKHTVLDVSLNETCDNAEDASPIAESRQDFGQDSGKDSEHPGSDETIFENSLPTFESGSSAKDYEHSTNLDVSQKSHVDQDSNLSPLNVSLDTGPTEDQGAIADSPLDAPADDQTYLQDPTLAAIEDEPLGLLKEDGLILSKT